MKKTLYIILIIVISSFALLPYSLNPSEAKYRETSDDYLIQVVNRAQIGRASCRERV